MIIQTTNEHEKTVLQQFKEKVADLEQDEITLIRFLKARDYNEDKAENMLRESIIWRKKNEIDNLLNWNAPSFMFEDLRYKITGFSNSGGPVVWIPIASWNYRPWVDQGHGDEMERWGYRIIENGYQALRSTKGGRHQAVLIIDLAKLTYYQASHLGSLKLLYNCLRGLEMNYPEVLGSFVIVNAPWLFSIPYNFVKHIMSEHTLSKLKVFDSNKKVWMDYLLDLVPQKSLPQEYFEDENGN